MILRREDQGAGARFSLEDLHKPGFVPGKKWLMTLKSAEEERIYEISGDGLFLSKEEMPDGPALIGKLYRDTAEIGNLVCVAPVYYSR